MNLISRLLPASNVLLDLPASSKKRAFEQAGLLFENNQGVARAKVFDSLFARERLGSTGLGQGVAIPHGRIKGLKEAVAAFVRVAEPIPFDAPDGQPVSVMIFLLVPEQASQAHLDLLSELAQMLSDKAFRQSLLDYNAGLRTLIDKEDEIKFDVRRSLRNLSLDREQYEIAVASAALAYERRISTMLQLRLGLEGIRVQDVLDAQGAYTESLSQLAGSHVRYVLDRIGLFLDLELLQVDEQGFWTQLYDEDAQPAPNRQLPDYALPVYGQLPRGTLPSHPIKRMLQVPPGQTMIHRTGP